MRNGEFFEVKGKGIIAINTPKGTKLISDKISQSLISVSQMLERHYVLHSRDSACKTPFEAWFGVRLSVVHLRIFECVCYIHVLETKREKLEQKTVTDVVLRYNNSKTYRVSNLQTQKVVRNVKFNEAKTWNCKRVVVHDKKNLTEGNFPQEQDVTET